MIEWLHTIGGDLAVILWEMLVGIAVPIAAAGVAAWVVILQIRKTVKHRREERRSLFVEHLARSFIDAAQLAEDYTPNNRDGNADFRRKLMESNMARIKALGVMRRKDLPVYRWAGSLAHDIQESTSGDHYKQAAEAINKLVQWQRHDIRTRAFS